MTTKKVFTLEKSKFIKTAKALGCDESETAFDAKLKKLAASKPTAALSQTEES